MGSQVEDPEKMTEEERENVEKEVGDALDENFKAMTEKQETREKRINSTEGEDEEEDSEESEESEENKEEKKEALEKEEAGPSKDSEPSKTAETKDKEDTESLGDNAKEGEDKKAQEIEDEEEPSNLQLAWEMLEVPSCVDPDLTESSAGDTDALNQDSQESTPRPATSSHGSTLTCKFFLTLFHTFNKFSNSLKKK